jgi:hypothetical protein
MNLDTILSLPTKARPTKGKSLSGLSRVEREMETIEQWIKLN